MGDRSRRSPFQAFTFLWLVIGVGLAACSGKGEEIYEVRGVAQKGPFASGATVEAAELSDGLVPTGRTFKASIADDTGSFTVPGVKLSSHFVQLTADGFYFDEVMNELSSSRIVLNALADVTSAASLNANILSHLEGPRVEHLIREGYSFSAAKAKSQSEVLGIFGITLEGSAGSETLDIVGASEADVALLAISAIVQGYRTPGEVTELLSKMRTDLRTDGILDDASLGSELMNAAVLVDMASVRANLQARYESLGASANIGNFEQYVSTFVDAKTYPFTADINYPASGAHGANLLDPNSTSFGSSGSLRADLPPGTSVRIVLTRTAGTGAAWSFPAFQNSCWSFTVFDMANERQEFSVTRPMVDQSCDMNIFLDPGNTVLIEYYENGNATASHSKEVTSI
jgi:hypothetical protein